MGTELRTDQIKDCIIEVYKAGRGSLLLLGPPGIGKTTAVCEATQEIAKLEAKEFVDYEDAAGLEVLKNPSKYFMFNDFNLNQDDPVSLSGVLREVGDFVVYKPLLWAVCFSKGGGIIFLDEYTNIQRPDMISASQKIVLEHKAGFTKFSKDTMVIAAGNNPEESSLANLLPVPVVDKFTIVKVSPPTLEKWSEWMDIHFGDDWDRKSLGYLYHFKSDFLSLPPETTETLTNFPTPRSWTKIATLLPKISQRYLEVTTIGTVGPEVGDRYLAYLRTEVPDVKEILGHPEKFKGLSMDAQYLATIIIGNHLKDSLKEEKESEKEKEVERTIPFFRALLGYNREFAILVIISTGIQRFELASMLAEKDKDLQKFLKEVALMRAEVEA